MKKREDDPRGKGKRFLDLPEYPGGKEAFARFIRENLRYPEQALRKGTQGQVHVHYWVNDSGDVIEAEVTHGIGDGCDEEALRLVRMLKYGGAKNRGMRVRSAMRTRIEFRLPPRQELRYEYAPKTTEKGASGAKDTPAKVSYTITIRTNGPVRPD